MSANIIITLLLVVLRFITLLLSLDILYER